MSISLGLATLLGAGLSFGGGLISNIINKSTANQNLAFQREANNQNIAFQKQENEITRQREDNAITRASIDMQNAGLSKTLAAGNPASAQSLTAPQKQALNNQFKYESALQKMNIAQLVQDMAIKNKEIGIKEGIADSEIAKNYAQADELGSSSRYHTALAKLTEDKSPFVIEQLRKDIDFSSWQIQNAIADHRLKAETTNKVIAETAHTIASTNHLSKQDELLVQQTISEILSQEKLKLDLDNTKWDMSWYHGQRIPVGSLGHIGKDASLFAGNVNNILNGLSFGLYDKLQSIISRTRIW